MTLLTTTATAAGGITIFLSQPIVATDLVTTQVVVDTATPVHNNILMDI